MDAEAELELMDEVVMEGRIHEYFGFALFQQAEQLLYSQ